MTRNPELFRMRNLGRYLEKHKVTLHMLARATGRTPNGIHNALRRGQMGYECCLMLATLFEAEGWKVPRNLFVNDLGEDLFALPTLRRLTDGRVVTVTRGSIMSRARVAARYLASEQLNPTKKENKVQPLTLTARRRFGLSFDPFRESLQTTDDVLETPEHKAAIEEIIRAIRRQDFIAVVGEHGCGKTTCVRTAIERLPKDCHVISPLGADKHKITGNNLYDAIILDLTGELQTKGSLPAGRERKARKVLSLLEAIEKQDRLATLIIEDAQLLSIECLRSLKHLHELSHGFKKLLSIILVAQREIMKKLNDPDVREVGNRCAVFPFYGLNGKAEAYIRHTVTRAGGDPDRVFEPAALKELSTRFGVKDGRRMWGPYPLQLNRIMAAAMNEADELGHKQVTVGDVDAVKPSDER